MSGVRRFGRGHGRPLLGGLLGVLVLTVALPGGGPPTPDPGLVAWWRFGEGAGQAAADASANGNAARLVNSPTWSPEVPPRSPGGGSLTFRGTGQLVNDSLRLDGNAVTLSLWVRPAALGAGIQRYLTVRSEVAVLRYDGKGGASALDFYLKTDGRLRHLKVATPLAIGQWYHLAGTWDGTTQRLYKNGLELTSARPGGRLDAARGVSIGSPGESPNATLHDVRVYDRALTPGAIAALAESSPLRVAAYYYPWYGSGRRHWQEGYLRRDLTPPQPPLLGEYDSRDPTTVATQLGWAQRYGVASLIASWWGPGSYEDQTIRSTLMPSPALGDTRIALLYESSGLLPVKKGVITFDPPSEAKLIAEFDYLARTYLTDPRYERIDGKPVVYLYVSRIFRGDYARALTDLRAAIRARYGLDLYLVGDEVEWGGTPDPRRIQLFDAITAYTMYSVLQTPGWPADTGFLAGVRQRYAAYRSVAQRYGVRFIPDVQPGFNDRGVRLAANHYVLPREVSAAGGAASQSGLMTGLLDAALPFVDPTLNVVTVTSWNEWHEDTQIEPTAPAAPTKAPSNLTQGYRYASCGFQSLDILKRFADGYRPG